MLLTKIYKKEKTVKERKGVNALEVTRLALILKYYTYGITFDQKHILSFKLNRIVIFAMNIYRERYTVFLEMIW